MDSTYIDVSKLPQTTVDRLADATLNLLKAILATPGGREALDAKTAARKARQTQKETV